MLGGRYADLRVFKYFDEQERVLRGGLRAVEESDGCVQAGDVDPGLSYQHRLSRLKPYAFRAATDREMQSSFAFGPCSPSLL